MTSCCFRFTTLPSLFTQFVAQHFFRVGDDVSLNSTKTNKYLLEPIPEAAESEKEEEYVSCLTFKFQCQIPELESAVAEENVEPGRFGEDNAGPESPSEKDSEKSIEELRVVSSPKDRRNKWYIKYFAKHKDPNFVVKNHVSVNTEFRREKESDSDSDSTSSSSDGYSVKTLVVDCDSNEFLSDKDSDIVSEVSSENGSSQVKLDESDVNDTDSLESLWEHQDLIEQLKKARAVGLPTILEESDSPFDDHKPWKIVGEFLRDDPMDELHEFYKGYRERMRMFDILNYQKLYAAEFLQMKSSLASRQKPLIPTVLSCFCRRDYNVDASKMFVEELRVDLETVYVGQTCLSWEFLRWQYEKARALPVSKPQYNRVAGEFQQFQVLVQRFVENECFEGPRIQNYAKNRCVLRNLLQVPVIKEDCSKDEVEEHEAITSEMLEAVMEESIRIFWEFVKTDKDESSVRVRNRVELQNPTDYELLSGVQADLQKKVKKLKDIAKSGNCLVRKFKKCLEDESCRDVLLAQVDTRLVSRVLKMSRITTDQLCWCHIKLNNIAITDRKVQRDPCFLLFPCSDQ